MRYIVVVKVRWVAAFTTSAVVGVAVGAVVAGVGYYTLATII